MKIGTVGQKRRDGALEGEVGEGKLVDSTIVTSGTGQIGSEAATRVYEGGFGPVLQVLQWVFQSLAQVSQTRLVARI